MATEIERRFLVMSDEWRRYADAGVSIQQAYIAIEGLTVVRLRIAGTAATLTIKAVEDEDDLRTRREYEFGVPLADALDLMDDLQEQRTVRKIRHRLPHDGRIWEVDAFEGANAGLVIAEVELTSPDEPVSIPPWAGAEISHDRRYLNAALAVRPISAW
jgi:adenylate cyclase